MGNKALQNNKLYGKLVQKLVKNPGLMAFLLGIAMQVPMQSQAMQLPSFQMPSFGNMSAWLSPGMSTKLNNTLEIAKGLGTNYVIPALTCTEEGAKQVFHKCKDFGINYGLPVVTAALEKGKKTAYQIAKMTKEYSPVIKDFVYMHPYFSAVAASVIPALYLLNSHLYYSKWSGVQQNLNNLLDKDNEASDSLNYLVRSIWPEHVNAEHGTQNDAGVFQKPEEQQMLLRTMVKECIMFAKFLKTRGINLDPDWCVEFVKITDQQVEGQSDASVAPEKDYVNAIYAILDRRFSASHKLKDYRTNLKVKPALSLILGAVASTEKAGLLNDKNAEKMILQIINSTVEAKRIKQMEIFSQKEASSNKAPTTKENKPATL